MLLVAGVVLVNATITWTVEARYVVGTGPLPDDLDWTLWVPRPVDPLPVDWFGGGVRSMGAVETEHGTMENLTGRGSGGISFVLRQTIVAIGSISGHVDLSARGVRLGLGGSESRSYWVWRASGDANQTLFVHAYASWHGERLDQEESGCGPYFEGETTEGWSLLPDFFCEGGGHWSIIPWEALGFLSIVKGPVLLIRACVAMKVARGHRPARARPPVRRPAPRPQLGR